MDPLALMQILQRTAAAYRVSLTELELDVYLDELAALDEVTIRGALTRYRQGGRSFFPTVPEILKAASELAAARGVAVDGASAWEAMQRALFGQWSEASDRLISTRIAAGGPGYPWPNERCREIVKARMNRTVRGIAQIESAYELDKVRGEFIRLYNANEAADEAEQTVARLAPPETVPIPIPPRPQRPRLVSGEE